MSPTAPPQLRYSKVKLTNRKGALMASADFYAWGLQDKQDLAKSAPKGIDLRAAGVQSFANGDERLLVFAVNNWTRWSNAAAHEFDVVIDVDRDGEPDFIVFSYDSGGVRTDTLDGLTEVFVYDLHKQALSAAGYTAEAPTDSSTILLPVKASTLGITGAFDYTVESYSLLDDTAFDEFGGMATYDPWRPAISNSDYVMVPVNRTMNVRVAFDLGAVASQKPLGTMVVVFDNKSGKSEALLLPRPKF